MKVAIEKNIFLEGIRTVQRASAGYIGSISLSGILVKVRSNQVVLTGGDSNLCIETTIEAECEDEGAVVVDSKLLGDIVRNFPEEKLLISTIDDKFIQISCEKNSAKLMYMEEAVFPKLPSIKENIAISLPQNVIKKVIKGTIFATSQDGIRPIISGVLFDFKHNMLNAVAVDGYRAAIMHRPIESHAEISAVVPGKALGEIERILEWQHRDVSITFTSNQILFTLGETRIISTVLQGDFGKYESFVPQEHSLKINANRQALINSLETAAIIGREGKKSPVILDVQENIMVITSSSEFGESRSEINIVSKGFPLVIKFNSRYLLDALQALEEEEITIEFTSSNSVCAIKNRSSDSSVHIVSPLRI